MSPETHLALHHARAAELRAEAGVHRLGRAARGPRSPRGLRSRLGWVLVEVGLRLATTSRATAAVPCP